MKKNGRLAWDGCWTALATPFLKSGGLDEKAFARLIRLQLAGGVSGLVVCGSTGESATLTHEEYRRVIELALRESQGRAPVVAGVAANATWKAVELARECGALGVDALLVLAPYYNKPTQDGLFEHFAAVARSTRLPVIVYNIPGRTAVNILPQTLARMVNACPNIGAVKEASGNLDQVAEILTLLPAPFALLSGDDGLTLPMMSIGARGVVSVVSNVAPRETQALCDAFLAGDTAKAERLHRKLFPLIKALFVETNPIPVKTALSMMGICGPGLRLPLTELSRQRRPALRAALKRFGGRRNE